MTTLKPGTPQDLDTVLALRNDPASVRYFKRPRALSREEYASEWALAFAGSDTARRVLMITQPPETVGALLYSLSDDGVEAEVSIYIHTAQRGKGLGTEALREGCAYAFNQYGVRRITAIVHRENTASAKAFANAGFTLYDNNGTFQHYDLWRKQ
jgi:RimJ/RimL family protein N-acetyltransferase